MSRILLVDDEADLLKALAMMLRTRRHEVVTATSGLEAERLIDSSAFDLLVSDIRMAPMDGFKLLRSIHATRPDIPIVLMTAYANLDIALDTIKHGAFDFITKPFKIEDLYAVVERALEYPRIVKGFIQLDTAAYQPWLKGTLIAKSPAMKALCSDIERIAPSLSPALIVAEPGTGRQQTAQRIHELSPLRAHPFRMFDCANSAAELRRELLDPAATQRLKGTVLLTHLEQLDEPTQKELFPLVRQDRSAAHHPELRLLAASHAPVPEKGRPDRFYQELFRAFSGITLRVPPLRERVPDLLPLISYIINLHTPDTGIAWKISSEAFYAIEHHPWPDNVTELERIVLGLIKTATKRVITPADLPPALLDIAERLKTSVRFRDYKDDLRGHSFRDYIRLKQQELSPFGPSTAPA